METRQGGDSKGLHEQDIDAQGDRQIGKDKPINDKTLSAGHSTDISKPDQKTEGTKDKNVEGQVQSDNDGKKIEPIEQNKVPVAGVSDAAQAAGDRQPVEGTGAERGAMDKSGFTTKPISNTQPTRKL